MRVALCIKKDIFGLLAARAFIRELALPAMDLRVFCSVKTRPVENEDPLPRLLKCLERDFPMDTLLAAEGAGTARRHQALDPERWEPLHDLNAPGGALRLHAWQPEIVVSIRFSLIFPPQVIEAIPAGILNVHPGHLPAYRGLYAPFWQVMNGERRLGTTLHMVDCGIDTGPVVAVHETQRRDDRSLLWHIGELYRGGAVLAARTVRQAAAGQVPKGVVQPRGGRYWRIPTRAQAEDFQRGPMPLVTTADYLDLLREALLPDPPEALARSAAY